MLDPATKEEVKEIIFKHLNPGRNRVFIFGSRASGTDVKYSDIDLGIETEKEIPGYLISEIEEDFENSDIPYRVDVVDFSRVSEDFKRVALKDVIYLN